MRLRSIKIYLVNLPFLEPLAHAARNGSSATNVVAAVFGHGRYPIGFGEGVPHHLPIDAVMPRAAALIRHPAFPWKLGSVRQIGDYVNQLPESREDNPIVCAIELALLDALGYRHEKPVAAFFPSHWSTERIHYGATVPLGNPLKTEMRCLMIQKAGIRHVRLKVNDDLHDNTLRLKTVHRVLGGDCDLRIDPNGTWQKDAAMDHLPLIQEHPVRVVEEPMPMDTDGFSAFADELTAIGVDIMACQSVWTMTDLRRVVMDSPCRIVNIKLSRSGGMHRALRMIHYLRQQQFAFQLGCHLGESGILSAAGRTLNLLCKDAVYRDGSYDRFILKENLTADHIDFGYRGEAQQLTGNGFGVRIRTAQLDSLKTQKPLTVKDPGT